jgi:LysM repeat protein
LNINQTICISTPGGDFKPTVIPGATVTALSPYANATVAVPGPTPFGTTPLCGKYYKVNPGDYCQQISLNQTITVDLFEEINPSINTNCTNLTPGLYYCVYPVAGWNATSVGNCVPVTTAVAPAPTNTGTVSPCYAWHKVVSGDYCALLQQQFNITFAQLQSWNPSLHTNCDNLVLGDA